MTGSAVRWLGNLNKPKGCGSMFGAIDSLSLAPRHHKRKLIPHGLSSDPYVHVVQHALAHIQINKYVNVLRPGPRPSTAAAILFLSWLQYTSQSLTWKNNLTQSGVLLTTYPVVFCMLGGLSILRRSTTISFTSEPSKIKGQHEPFCLKWLESALTTGQHFQAPAMSSLWALQC